MQRFVALFLLLFALPLTGQAQQAHQTEVKLDKGNIDLSVVDGTMLSLAPDTHIAVTHAANPGEITHVKVHKGELHVSNVFHRHSDVMRIEVGEHMFELNRGAALIAHNDGAPHATLLHGRSLGAVGHPDPITKPGMRMRTSGTGFRKHQPDPDAVRDMLNQVGGPGSSVRGQDQDTGKDQENGLRKGLNLLPTAPRQRNARQHGGAPANGRNILQRDRLQKLLETHQGNAPPPPPKKPPKMPAPPPMNPPPPMPPMPPMKQPK